MANNNYVLIGGESATGKTASLRNLKNPEGVLYLNAEINKPIPFRNKFIEVPITDPFQIYDAFDKAKDREEIHTIVIDSLTFLMSMFESKYIVGAKDGRSAWGNYQQFFKKLMYEYVANSPKRVIFIAHTALVYFEESGTIQVQVPVKGALKDLSVEAFFSIVVMARKIPVKELLVLPQVEQNLVDELGVPYLTITPQEEALGFKHVFQVAPTKSTATYRIRGAMGMFPPEVAFMNNDAEQLLDIITNYYSGE